MLDAIAALEKAIDLVQVRLEDLRVVLQFARLDEPGVELLTPLVVTRIVLARIAIAFPPMSLQQALAAVGQEHRHVPLTRHPSGVDEAQFAEVAELGVPRVQRPIVAVAEVLGGTTRNAPTVARVRLSEPRNVYSRSPSKTRSRSGPRGRSSSRRKTSRGSRTVALTHVAVTRIPPRALGDCQRFEDHVRAWRTLPRKTLPCVAVSDRCWRLDSSNRHHLHHLAAILAGPLLGAL